MKVSSFGYTYIMNDFCILPELCNFSCDYCIYSNATVEQKSIPYKISKYYDKSGDNIEFFDYVANVLMNSTQCFPTPILRICGGELFLLKNIMYLLRKIHEKFETVQIISNGFFLTPYILSEIKELGNCVLHISLDGHTQELNAHRVHSSYQQEIILNNINHIIKLGIPLEIASCLTDRNTKDYEEVVKFFNDIEGDILLLPFPVRGKGSEMFVPSKQDQKQLFKILERYDLYSKVLPPIKYVESLMNYYENGYRNIKCYIPKAIVQTFYNGDIYSCCMDWSVRVANINSQNRKEIIEQIQKNRIYNIYDMFPPKLRSCRECFTVSEIINLYFEGKISDKELCNMQLFSGKTTLKMMNEFRKEIIKNVK